ncbi:DinB family protein [Alteribacter natronophilus]|uniref:DinB family protein n=1 Tax=Alteribacter natronophilus TaxID=2583810 RepID=UPI00110EBFF0|nr:DinB family protein [Alteribacter natronophilus]TMW72892.1 DUF664 domain-containing protein [Alteribacter natronophilus]
MLTLFTYNWQVREEWFEWAAELSEEELLKDRTGGPGSILFTLYHVADAEYSWIRAVYGLPDKPVSFESVRSLDMVRTLSDKWNREVRNLLESGVPDLEGTVTAEWAPVPYRKGDVLRHIIAHEIHHMGQLSVWAREIGHKPVSANVIGRELPAIPGNRSSSELK